MTGKNLRKNRLELDLSQRQLATALGVSEKTVCNWEKQERISQLLAIAMTALILAAKHKTVELALREVARVYRA